MQLIDQLCKWWRERTDPGAKARRKQRRKEKAMAEFLDRNQRKDSEDQAAA